MTWSSPEDRPGDWDSGQVGLIMGEMLGLPCISLAKEHFKWKKAAVVVEKERSRRI